MDVFAVDSAVQRRTMVQRATPLGTPDFAAVRIECTYGNGFPRTSVWGSLGIREPSRTFKLLFYSTTPTYCFYQECESSVSRKCGWVGGWSIVLFTKCSEFDSVSYMFLKANMSQLCFKILWKRFLSNIERSIIKIREFHKYNKIDSALNAINPSWDVDTTRF